MAGQNSLSSKICDGITKYSIYLLMFLAPIFFLPWTSEVLDFNKQTLSLFLIFIALFAWMIKVLVSGKLSIKLSKVHIFIGVLFLSGLLSTLFSVYRYGSFWGYPQSTSGSFLTILCFCVLYFLVSNVLSKKEIYVSAVLFYISLFVAQIYGILQLFSLYILPFDFAKTNSFNTIGTAGSLGFLSAILLPLTIVLMISSKKWLRGFFIAVAIFSMALFLVVDYSIIWWAVIAGAVIVMVLMVLMRDIFDGRWMSVPVFFLAISLFFVLLNPSIPGIGQKTNEVFLSQQTTWQIAFNAIKEMPVFGSGLGTFAYDFSKFKDASFSSSSLWSVTFSRGSSEILNTLSTTGVLGILAFLVLIVSAVFYAAKNLITEKISKTSIKDRDENYLNRICLLGFGASFVVECIVFCIYNSNFVLSLYFFFALAVIVSLTTQEKQEYELKPSSLATLVVTFVFTLGFIFGLGILMLDGQRYVAEAKYYSGLVKINANDLDGGAKEVEAAVAINPSSDLYYKQLSQIYLLQFENKVSSVASDALTDDQKTEMQTLLANSVNAGKKATDYNPKSVSNWSSLAYVYQNLYGYLTDSGVQTIAAYDEALKLDPNNPYIYAQQGYSNLVSAYGLSSDQSSEKSEYLSKAQEKLEKSIGLNSSYSNALYYLGLVYNAKGDKQKAIDEFEKVQQLNPDNEDIKKIIDTLKSGGTAATEDATAIDGENPSGSETDNPVKNPPETIE